MADPCHNEVVLVGRLGGDPDMKKHDGGSVRTTFSLATNENWTDRRTGEAMQHVEWHRVVCWGKLAEFAGEYMRKGRRAFVRGRIRSQRFERDGAEVRAYEIHADTVLALDDAKRSEAGETPQSGAATRERPRSRTQSLSTENGKQDPPATGGGDDIPFGLLLALTLGAAGPWLA